MDEEGLRSCGGGASRSGLYLVCECGRRAAEIEADHHAFSERRSVGQMKFTPPVADLTSPAVQGKLDARLCKSVHDGKPNAAMGAWREALSDDEIWDVLAYVRTLTPEQTGGMGSGLR